MGYLSRKTWVVILCAVVLFSGNTFFSRAWGATVEQQLVAEAAQKLEYLSVCAQKAYNYMHSELYPGPERCGSSICWNSSSIVGSTERMMRDLEPTCRNLDLSHTAVDGDVRYRCRYQKGEVICFAYRCHQRDPAGCEQRWRLERRRAGSGDSGVMKCVDVGGRDSCEAFEEPPTPICPEECQ